MNDPIANPLDADAVRYARDRRRADYRQAYDIAEKIIDDTIARGIEDGTLSGGFIFSGTGTNPYLTERLEATIRLAEWLQGDNPVIEAIDKARSLVAEALEADIDPLKVHTWQGPGFTATIGISGAEAIAHRTALRHLAQVANDFFVERGVIGVGDPTRQTFDGNFDSSIELLDIAVTDAYNALDWPRYPEPEGN